MGKNIRDFIPGMKSALLEYKIVIVDKLREIKEEEESSYRSKFFIEWKIEELQEELGRLREYMKICIDLLEQVPESNKRISSIQRQISPLINSVNTVNLNPVSHGHEIVQLINRIKFLQEGIRN